MEPTSASLSRFQREKDARAAAIAVLKVRVLRLRECAGLTQAELARDLNELDESWMDENYGGYLVTKSKISRLENGDRTPAPLIKLYNAYFADKLDDNPLKNPPKIAARPGVSRYNLQRASLTNEQPLAAAV